MNIFPWTSDFSVGVYRLDEQHQEMMMLVNKLFESLLQGTNTRDTDSYIAELQHHSQIHFKFEEHTMAETGYSEADTARHLAEHAAFQEKLTDFAYRAQQAAGTLELYDLTRELAQFLKSWIVTHLTGEDRKLGRHLNARGLH